MQDKNLWKPELQANQSAGLHASVPAFCSNPAPAFGATAVGLVSPSNIAPSHVLASRITSSSSSGSGDPVTMLPSSQPSSEPQQAPSDPQQGPSDPCGSCSTDAADAACESVAVRASGAIAKAEAAANKSCAAPKSKELRPEAAQAAVAEAAAGTLTSVLQAEVSALRSNLSQLQACLAQLESSAQDMTSQMHSLTGPEAAPLGPAHEAADHQGKPEPCFNAHGWTPRPMQQHVGLQHDQLGAVGQKRKRSRTEESRTQDTEQAAGSGLFIAAAGQQMPGTAAAAGASAQVHTSNRLLSAEPAQAGPQQTQQMLLADAAPMTQWGQKGKRKARASKSKSGVTSQVTPFSPAQDHTAFAKPSVAETCLARSNITHSISSNGQAPVAATAQPRTAAASMLDAKSSTAGDNTPNRKLSSAIDTVFNAEQATDTGLARSGAKRAYAFTKLECTRRDVVWVGHGADLRVVVRRVYTQPGRQEPQFLLYSDTVKVGQACHVYYSMCIWPLIWF